MRWGIQVRVILAWGRRRGSPAGADVRGRQGVSASLLARTAPAWRCASGGAEPLGTVGGRLGPKPQDQIVCCGGEVRGF